MPSDAAHRLLAQHGPPGLPTVQSPVCSQSCAGHSGRARDSSAREAPADTGLPARAMWNRGPNSTLSENRVADHGTDLNLPFKRRQCLPTRMTERNPKLGGWSGQVPMGRGEGSMRASPHVRVPLWQNPGSVAPETDKAGMSLCC